MWFYTYPTATKTVVRAGTKCTLGTDQAGFDGLTIALPGLILKYTVHKYSLSLVLKILNGN